MAYKAVAGPLRWYARSRGVLSHGDPRVAALGLQFRDRLEGGETLYLIGLVPGGHDSGASLVEASRKYGVRLLASHEEDRLVGKKFWPEFPANALGEIARDIRERGIHGSSVFGLFAGFDYVELWARLSQAFAEELPRSIEQLQPNVYPGGRGPLVRALSARDRAVAALGLSSRPVVIGMPHHGNHAAIAWALSPFVHEDESDTAILVLDGAGDDGAFSIHGIRDGRPCLQYSNSSFWDSLGHYYAAVSSEFGGWSIGAAEGRWMAAAAFGHGDRSTNRFYPLLRELLDLAPEGRVNVNRELANWHVAAMARPFSHRFLERLRAIGGESLLGNGVEPLSFDPSAIPPDEQPRLDLAAASQMVFEDALLHIVDDLVDRQGVRNLILSGGTALNCVANLRLVERFGAEGRATHERVRVWIPPTPADDGVHAGAAIQFALQNGARVGESTQSPFLEGRDFSSSEVKADLRRANVEFDRIGSVLREDDRREVAEQIVRWIDEEGSVGLFQGRAAIGRRALGHRSIFDDPRDPDLAMRINSTVKDRELYRPVAPVCTRKAAEELFDMVSWDDALRCETYGSMIVAARARERARRLIPGVIHRDGTARIQIVSPGDELTVALLEAAGRRFGVEVLMNTSLNLRSPIVATPFGAAEMLHRSRGLRRLVVVSREGVTWGARRGT